MVPGGRLDVHVEDGNGSVTTVQIVGAGQVRRRARGLAPDDDRARQGAAGPRRSLTSPARATSACWCLSGSGINVAEAACRKEGRSIPPARWKRRSSTRSWPPAASSASSWSCSNVEAAARCPTYPAGRADGVFSTVPFVLPAVAASRQPMRSCFADYGLEFPSFGLFATEEQDQAARRGDPASSRASSRGAWEYIYAGHEDEA